MSWRDKDWVKTLSTVAPSIAAALGGPLAGVAVATTSKVLGIENGDEEKVAEAVASGNPDVMVKLREAENEFKLELKRMGVDLEKIHAKDRASARDLAKSQGQVPQIVLAVIYTGGFLWLLWALFTGEVALGPDQRPIANILLGILSAGQAQVMNFFFGSSSGSKAKTAQMGQMGQKQ